MADQTPTRRSGRGRIPNKKYADDSLKELNTILDSDPEQEVQGAEFDASDNEDEEFRAETVISVPSAESGSASGPGSPSSGVATPVEDADDLGDVISDHDEPVISSYVPVVSMAKEKPKRRKRKPVRSTVRSRGIPDNPLSGFNKLSRLVPLAGPAKADQEVVLKSLQHWIDEATLPRRSRFRFPFTHTPQKRDMESSQGWDWYYDHGGKSFFAEGQRLRDLGPRESARYFPKPTHMKPNVLLGPYGGQKAFSLPQLQCLSVDEAWRDAISAADEQERGATGRRQHAWLLNAGDRVRCLDWATNQDTERQYLAIATKRPRSEVPAKVAPAFNAAPGTPSAIQIWCFHSLTGNEREVSSFDSDRPPELKQMWCVEWGDPKQLKWCPMPRKRRDEHGDHDELGLLAAVFDDGIVRLLDISVEKSVDQAPMYLKLDSAAITLRPLHGSIATCVCWLSATDIAVGHSSGFLAVFSIDPRKYQKNMPQVATASGTTPVPTFLIADRDHSQDTPAPWLIQRIHQSYITSLTSAYPSFPNFLASTSVDGKPRLTSIPQVHACHVYTRRTNTPPSCAAYHHALHGFVIPEDARELVSFTGLRFWGSYLGIGEAGTGGVTAVDVGKVHASMVFGCTDGKVVVSNPIRRVMRGNEKVWQLTVFRHEWAKLPAQQSDEIQAQIDQEEPVEADGVGGTPRQRLGTSRITEAYKVHQADVDTNATKRSIIVGPRGSGRGSAMTTIFEEETGVTAICWNPNLHCGGWLAVGWGSGLVRVEDVAI